VANGDIKTFYDLENVKTRVTLESSQSRSHRSFSTKHSTTYIHKKAYMSVTSYRAFIAEKERFNPVIVKFD